MPAGNLCVIHQPSGSVIATGRATTKQCETAILEHMTTMASNTEDTGPITSSYQVFTPYKGFGERGVKAYSVERDQLIEPTKTVSESDTESKETETPISVEDVSPQEVVL